MARFLRSYPNTYAGTRPAHSRLGKPVVVAGATVFRPVKTTLAVDINKRGSYNKRRKTTFKLKPPTVLALPPNAPVKVKLNAIGTSRRNPKRQTLSLLAYPVVVHPSVAFYGPGRYLTNTLRREAGPNKGRRRLTIRSPYPVVIFPSIAFSGPRVKLIPLLGRVPKTNSALRKPTVVGEATTFIASPIKVELAYSRRGKPKSGLGAPIVVYPEIKAAGYLLISLAPSRREPLRLGRSDLGPPVVITGPTPSAGVLAITLAPSRRPVAKSALQKPVVVGVTVAEIYYGPKTRLAPTPYTRLAKKPRSTWVYPIVITVIPAAGYLAINLAPSRREPLRNHSYVLLPPPIIDPFTGTFGGTLVVLVPSRRPVIKSVLRRPIVVGAAAAEIYFGPRVKFAPSHKGKTIAKLFAPAVIAGAIVYAPITTHLAYSRRGTPEYRLRPPVVLSPVDATLLVRLAYSRRGKPISKLRPPAVVGAARIFRPIATTLAIAPDDTGQKLSKRAPHSKLKPPAVIGAAVVFGPIRVELAYSRRGKPINKLRPPSVVAGAIVYAPVKTKLAPSTKLGRIPQFVLKPPAVVGAAIVYAPVKTKLTYSRRGKPKSKLFAPITVAPQFFQRPLQVFLAPSSRGIPKYKLAAPIVIGAATIFRPIETTLAPSTRIARAANNKEIKPPAVIGGAIVFRPVAITLAVAPDDVGKQYSKRAPHSKLRIPVVVGASFIPSPIVVELAPSKRGKSKSRLFAPVVIGGATLFRPVKTTLVGSHKLSRTADSKLRPPAIVGAVFVSRPISISLAPTILSKTSSALRTPTVVEPQFFARPITIKLAASSRGKPISRLYAPSVVGAGEVFHAIIVKLAPSSRGVPKSRLVAPVVISGAVIFRPLSVTIAKQNLVQDRLARSARFKLIPPTVVFTGPRKGYHSRTKINSRESTLVIVLNKPQRTINSRESNIDIVPRGTSRDRINDRESDVDIS